MKNIQLLDCTLRDGGRIIDCNFADSSIRQIASKLVKANIDIVEVGFLRDARKVHYHGDSTFFTDVSQIEPLLPVSRNHTEFAAFIDYGMFDFMTLKEFDGNSIHSIRLGFTKVDYDHHKDGLLAAFQLVKEKGYKLYIQAVNLLNYSDKELLDILEMVNAIKPAGFGIVDTYGAMYVDDVARFFQLIDHNLAKEIAIDFHSHNNFQLSFSFAQEVIRLAGNTRKIIIDATLNGMGKSAGNLSTELIADYLVRKKLFNYDTEVLFDIIDEHIYDIKQKHSWGYSVASLLAGIYRSHPNNVIYLTDKFRLNTKGIKNILAMMDEKERQRYDYDKLDALILEYNSQRYDDNNEIEWLMQTFGNRPILVLAPGSTLETHKEAIHQYIAKVNPIIISVNFLYEDCNSYAFFANAKRYPLNKTIHNKVIVTSNIAVGDNNEIVVDYQSLINQGYKMVDNSTVMLLNLLKRLKVNEIVIAGLDGFDANSNSNYFDKSLNVERLASRLEEINADISELLSHYLTTVRGSCHVKMITPSRFERIFQND